MQIYHFTRLIRKYSVAFDLLRANPGSYDNTGKWRPGAVDEERCMGAIVPYGSNAVQSSQLVPSAGGVLSADDRKLMSLERLPIGNDSRVRYRNRLYAITEENPDQSEYGDVMVYRLKYLEDVTQHA